MGPTIIGSVVAYIAYQQWRTNRAPLREKLFDRRYEIYLGVLEFCGELATGNCSDECLSDFTTVYRQSAFILSDDTRQLLKEFRDLGIDLRLATEKATGGAEPQDRDYWLSKRDGFQREVPTKFGAVFEEFSRYLSFDDVT